MNSFVDYFNKKVKFFKWLFSSVAIFFPIFFIIIGLSLTPFGLYNQTSIYHANWNQALAKYVPKEKYKLNKNFSDYNDVVLKQLTNIFNKNSENILTGLIANNLALPLNQAIDIKNSELNKLDSTLALIYNSKIDLWDIITEYNNLLFKAIEKYTDFSLNNNAWESNMNSKAIRNFISPYYEDEYFYKVELNYLLNGDPAYNWIDDENNKVYFQGLQYYEYYSYMNYLTILDAFVSGSIETDDPMLLGTWGISDLSYLQFLKTKIISENFYYPMYFQAFIIQRIANIILFIVLPTQTIATILLLIFIWRSKKPWNLYKKYYTKQMDINDIVTINR